MSKAAFNVFDYETIRAVDEAARKTGEAFICSFQPPLLGFMPAVQPNINNFIFKVLLIIYGCL